MYDAPQQAALPAPSADPSPAHLWRKEQLEKAGLDHDAADLIAADRSIELWFAVDIVKRVLLSGREPKVALDILL